MTIPANTTATVIVPTSDAASLTEGGKPAKEAAGLLSLRASGRTVVLEVGSGSYAFACRR